MLTYGSLFAGAGGFDLGLDRAGLYGKWQVEIDKQARSVLRYGWPDIPKHEDVRHVGKHCLEPVDLICGGFPCQDLSVAGRRAGLAGERSGLFFEFVRIVDELAPRWLLLENVPGLLSSNGGRDMGTVVGALAELGYGWTYRVLDAQHFGVPQRRRRVFIVGHLGGVCPPEILFEPESVRGNPPQGREAGEGAARGAADRPGAPRAYGGNRISGARDVSTALSAHGGPCGRLDFETETFVVAHTLRAEGFDASEDGTGRGASLVPALPPIALQDVRATKGQGGEFYRTDDRAFTLPASHMEPGVVEHAAAVPRRLTPVECERLMGWPDDHTRYGVTDEGKRVEMADGPRYRMAGNGVAAPVAQWIAERIKKSHEEMLNNQLRKAD